MNLRTLLRPWATLPLHFMHGPDRTHAAQCAPTLQHRLPARRTARFDSATDLHLHCIAGCLWVTSEGDPRDHVCNAGDGFVAPAGRHVIVYAFDDASFTTGALPQTVHAVLQ